MVSSTKNFEEKLSKLSTPLQNNFSNFSNELGNAKEEEILKLHPDAAALDTLTVMDFQGLKLYYNLSRNKEGSLDINFLDISDT